MTGLPQRPLLDLITRQEQPYNAEPSLDKLASSWVTPLKYFFQRSHGLTPEVDPERYTLTVDGCVEHPLTLTLKQLQGDFPRATVAATLQCAGNRRLEHSALREVEGVQWDAGAIGHAEWGGIPLASLLSRTKLTSKARNVWFTSLDACPLTSGETSPFGGSISLGKALQPDTLIALTMNGQPLTLEHGFPVRAIVPGFIGARSVKWLGAIHVSDIPSENFFMAKDYKIFPPDITQDTARWDTAEALEEFPINAVICQPLTGTSVPEGRTIIRGYACPPGRRGTSLARVEISADEGKHWQDARLIGNGTPFSWTLWEMELELAPGAHTLICRAVDSTGAVQPETTPWNFKGYGFNAWHRIHMTVAKSSSINS